MVARASQNARATRSAATSPPGPRSRLLSSEQRVSRGAGSLGSATMGFRGSPEKNRQRNSSASGAVRRTPRSSSTATTASGGASSDRRPNCRESRTERSTRKAMTDLADWRIMCNFVGKGHRRKRASRRRASQEQSSTVIANHGGGVVEGYPEPAGAVAAPPLQRRAVDVREARLRPRPKSGSTAGSCGRRSSRAADLTSQPPR